MEEWLKAKDKKESSEKVLSFKDRKKIKNEISKLERDIAAFNEKKSKISAALDKAGLPYDEIEKLSFEYNELNDKIALAEERWLELNC